jgi:hypothetical protein
MLTKEEQIEVSCLLIDAALAARDNYLHESRVDLKAEARTRYELLLTAERKIRAACTPQPETTYAGSTANKKPAPAAPPRAAVEPDVALLLDEDDGVCGPYQAIRQQGESTYLRVIKGKAL